MPKRFTDTDKWKKPFIRGLQGPYKLLWMYILDDCDHAGIWQVDFEVARIRIGEDVNFETALNIFGERIHAISKFKWFIPDFISFQYGELSEKNRLHVSVMNILSKYELGPSKPLIRGQGTIQGQGIGQGQGTEVENPNKSEIEKGIFGDEKFMEDITKIHKGKDLRTSWDSCWIHYNNSPRPPTEVWEWRQKLNGWLSRSLPEKKNGLNPGKIQ